MTVRRRVNPSGAVVWQARWRDPDGRQRGRTFPTRRAAAEFLATRMLALNGRSHMSQGLQRLTVQAVYDMYARDVMAQLRPSSRQNYSVAARNFLGTFGRWPVTRVTHASVQSWVSDLSRVKGPETVRMAYSVLSLTLGHAVKIGVLPENPCRGVRRPPPAPPRMTILTVRELMALADSRPRGRGAILTMGLMGLRWSEMAGLRWGAVDLDTRRLVVRERVTVVGGRIDCGRPKTPASIRHLVIPETLVAELKPPTPYDPLALVFPSPRGLPDRVDNWRRRIRWGAAVEAIGHPTLTPHDLRRTFGSLARAAGADLKYIQRAMGHASITTTARTYAHLYDTETAQVSAAIDRITAAESGPSGQIVDTDPDRTAPLAGQ